MFTLLTLSFYARRTGSSRRLSRSTDRRLRQLARRLSNRFARRASERRSDGKKNTRTFRFARKSIWLKEAAGLLLLGLFLRSFGRLGRSRSSGGFAGDS